MSIVYFYINHSLIFIMARRKRVNKINIEDKVRGNKLTAVEFNEVKNTVNELIDANDENLDEVEQSLTTVQTSIEDLLAQSEQLLSYAGAQKAEIDTLTELLNESAYLLNIHDEHIMNDEELLNASMRLLNNHEVRIMSVEELLADSANLLGNITASYVPTTNSNVQQDIDDLLLQSSNLLSYINTTQIALNTAKDDLRDYVDLSYNKLYSYIEDTTLTFTIEALKPDTEV